MTSFSVVAKVRAWTHCKKVGHAGTLDPLARGVLLVCTGKATKRVSELMELEKEYEGVIELGKTTETEDAEGKILQQRSVPSFSIEDVLLVLRKFVGKIDQIPPMYSALKKDGVRLYKLARKGKVVHREPRKIKIHEIKLLEWNNPFLKIRVKCSRGTYIRALARDIGETLGVGGYLKTLSRNRIGTYTIQDSYTLNTLRELLSGKHESL